MAEEIKNNFKCIKCGKEFGSKAALDMHMNAKHDERAAKNVSERLSKKSNKLFIITIFVIALVIMGIGAYYLTLNSGSGNKYDDFAKCLTEKNATMYGAFWCPHCKDQKKAFGSSFQYVNYIECSTPDRKAQLQICKDAKIDGYPVWIFNESVRRDGFVTLPDLAKITNCSLET